MLAIVYRLLVNNTIKGAQRLILSSKDATFAP